MDIKSKITRVSKLDVDDSLSAFNGFTAQQSHFAYEVFYNFFKVTKPKRILEIGTALGGFTEFLKYLVDELNIDCKILSYDIYGRSEYPSLIEKGIDIRIEDIFLNEYTDVKNDVKDFINSDGTTIVLCDGGNKIAEFNLLSRFIKEGDFILAHDYSENHEVFINEINRKIWNWHEVEKKDIISSCEQNNLYEFFPEIFNSAVWTCWLKTGQGVDTDIIIEKPQNNVPISEQKTYVAPVFQDVKNITLVTGLWDIGRSELKEGWSRSFEHYKEKLDKLLDINVNLIIYGDSELEKFVFKKRKKENTLFVHRTTDFFVQNEFYDKIQKIRKSPEWYNLAPWLKDSTQSSLEMYNPLVMSKMFLLNDARIMDPFDSEYMFWIDGGISNTVHIGYFTHDKVLNKIQKYINKFSFVCFPYDANNEVHGFEYNRLNQYAEKKVKKVARGGFFGGPKDSIADINGIYYGLLSSSLSEGFMGTEESLFSIMVYKYPELINYFEIEENGLLSKFFEDLKNDNLKIRCEQITINDFDISKTSLYVITFNSPNQFRTLLESMDLYDKNFLDKPKKFLLDNSTDESTFEEYSSLCNLYGFEHIKKDNLGICGGRQFIAEHFEETNQDYMFFFEDDMFFFLGEKNTCRNGFGRIVKNLYNVSLEIIKKENFDFLKLNYSEFFGDNGTQWSWYNVPQNKREEYWPENPKLPEHGLDPNAPKTIFNKVVSHKEIPYAAGEVYYCNWPQIVSKTGNKKMFLETKWAHPFEQTWMSYIYQLTKKQEVTAGLLLLTPTEHNRFEHYEKGLRKES